MKKILFSGLFLLYFSICYGQLDDYYKPFSKIVQEKTSYFELQKLQYGQKYLDNEGSEYQEFLKWQRFWEGRIAPNGSMFQYDSLLAVNIKNESNKSVGNIDDWREVGPFTNPTNSSVANIGIVHQIECNRINPNKLLAVSRAGGLFFTVDKGLSWNNAGSDKWWRSGCSAASFDPTNETTWYAASNVGGSHDPSKIGGLGGIYRTTDSGLTWVLIATKLTFDPTYGDATIVNYIKIDPQNPAIGYLATNKGLFKSNNINDINPSNVQWVKIHNDHIEDFEFKAKNSAVLLITHKDINGIWKFSVSTNQGSNFIVQPTSFNANTKQVIMEVTDANFDLVYFVNTYSGTRALSTLILSTSIWTPKYIFSEQIGWGHGLGVSNFNANIVYCSSGSALYKSVDGGTTFNYLVPNLHSDVEDIVSPSSLCGSCSNEIFIGTHGGFNYSNDNGTTTIVRNTNLGVGRIHGAATAAKNPEIIALGLDHEGSILSNGVYTQNWSPNWKEYYSWWDGGYTSIDYENSAFIYGESQSGAQNNTIVYSLSNSITTPLSGIFPSTISAYAKVYQNTKIPSIVYIEGKANGISSQFEEIYRISDYGKNTGISEEISKFNTISSITPLTGVWGVRNILLPETNSNMMYVDLYNGNPVFKHYLFRNTDVLNGSASIIKNSWEELPIPLGRILGVDIKNENIIYMSDGGNQWNTNLQLWKIDYSNPSTAIATMIDISGNSATNGLPDVPLTSLVMEKGSNGGIYVSNDLGVYYANNSTLNFINPDQSVWIKLGDNLPRIPSGLEEFGALEINYVSNTIRIATLGRGMWEHDLYCPANQSASYTGSQFGSNFYEVYDGIISKANITSNANITYRAGTSIQLNPGFSVTGLTSGYFEAFIHPCMYIGSSPGIKSIDEDHSGFESSNEQYLNKSVFESEISLFPNPNNGVFTLNINGSDTNYEIKVLNSLGQVVHSIKKTSIRNLDIDMNDFEDGLYIIQCTNEHDYKSIMFLKKE